MYCTPDLVSAEMESLMSARTRAPAYNTRSQSLPVGFTPFPTRRQSAIANLISRKKGEVEVILDGESGGYVHSYSTHDEIKGRVELRFEKDTPIYGLSIVLHGQSVTYVENMASTTPAVGRTTGRHTFLRLQQPIEDDALPDDRIARAGECYSIPFDFVVPDRLLVHVCNHKHNTDEVKRQHLMLPPSMGENTVAGDGRVFMDDFAPDMAKVIYAIRANVFQQNSAGRVVEIAEKNERIRIIPAREEEPPMSIDETHPDFVMRMEKSVKKGLFRAGKLGRIVAETLQPQSLRLLHPAKRSTEPITTTTTINLRFDPTVPDAQPPQLSCIASKLRIRTFFGATSFQVLPEFRQATSWSTLHGTYNESVSLSSRNLSTVTWIRHEAGDRTSSQASSDMARRQSVCSATSTIPEPSSAYMEGSHFYTASIVVPVSLPTYENSTKPKTFLPSFYSCILSRIYALEFQLSWNTPGANISAPRITLRAPVQISAEGGVPRPSTVESEEAIVAEIERQFGMFEARHGNGQAIYEDETPMYEETNPLETTRHMSVSVPQRTAPPEYFAGLPNRALEAGPPRTHRAYSSPALWMGPRFRPTGFAAVALML